MRNKTIVPGPTFKKLFRQVFSIQFIYALLRSCGMRFRRPPEVSADELMCSLLFHVVAGPGTLAERVRKLTGKDITDSALAQRRALWPVTIFEGMMSPRSSPRPIRPNIPTRSMRACDCAELTAAGSRSPTHRKSKSG